MARRGRWLVLAGGAFTLLLAAYGIERGWLAPDGGRGDAPASQA